MSTAEMPFPTLSAHRGGSGEGAENTLHAFRKAYALGINLLELDVHMSKDGHVVIAHDATLGRMCGPDYRGKKLADFTYKELPQMQKQIKIALSPGSYTLKDDETGRFDLLEDLFEEFQSKKVLFSIDLKA